MGEFPHLLSVIDHPEHAIIDKSTLISELLKFSAMWRTHHDRTGGWLGWRGKLTLLGTYSAHIYLQLLILIISLFLYFNFDLYNWKKFVLSVSPVFFMILLVIFNFIQYLLIGPAWGHRHYFSIPRSDKGLRRMNKKKLQSFCASFNQVLFKYTILAIVIFCTACVSVFGLIPYLSMATKYIVTMDYLAGHNSTLSVGNSTVIYENYIPRPGDYPLDITNLSVQTGFELAFGNAQLLVLWMTAFALFWIFPHFLFTLLTSVIGFFIGLFKGVGHVTTWKSVQRKFATKHTLEHFQNKLMGISSKGMSKKELLGLEVRVEWSWALVWNELIRSFFENHQMPEEEHTRLTYALDTEELLDEGKRVVYYKITRRPDLSKAPSNQEVIRQLCHFMNSLYMSMPNGDIMDAKKLVVMMPMCRETVRLSWEDLVKSSNTERCLLLTLLKRYPSDWSNFKDKEFAKGSKMRQLVEEIEAKVLAGVNVMHHRTFQRITAKYIKRLIRHWASQRFLTISRSTKGFMQIPRALSILLRIQHPELVEDDVKKLVKHKFSFILGPRLYDQEIWRYEMLYDETLSEKERELLDDRHERYQRNVDRLFKELGQGVAKTVHLENTPEGGWVSLLREWDDSESQFNTIHKVECMVDPSLPIGPNYKTVMDAIMRQYFDGSYYHRADCHVDMSLCQSLFFPNLLLEFQPNSSAKVIAFPQDVYNSEWSYSLVSSAFLDRMEELPRRFRVAANLEIHPHGAEVSESSWAMFTAGSKMNFLACEQANAFQNMINGATTKYVEYFKPGRGYNVDTLADTSIRRQYIRSMAHVACSRYPYRVLTSNYTSTPDRIFLCYFYTTLHMNRMLMAVCIYGAFSIRLITGIVTIIMPLITDSAIMLAIDPDLSSLFVIMIEVSCTFVLTQYIFLQSFTGMLASILEFGVLRGVFRTIWNYYAILSMMYFRTAIDTYHFQRGLSRPSRQLVLDTSHGTHHRAVVELYRTLKYSHFAPSLNLFILSVIGACVGSIISVYAYSFLLVMMLSCAPFLYNYGSFPFGITYQTWIRLFTDDYQCIKTWFVNNCDLRDVESIMRRDKGYRRLAFQNDDTDEQAQNVELDLEFYNLEEKRNSKPRLSIVELQDHKKKDETSMMMDMSATVASHKHMNLRENVLARNRLPEHEHALTTYGEGLPAIPISFKISPSKRLKNLFHKISGGLSRLKSRIFVTYEQIYLLLMLTIVKIVSYLFLIWAVIIPWAEPPNNEHIYKESFEKRAIEGRIIGIQKAMKNSQMSTGDDDRGQLQRKIQTNTERRFSTMEMLQAIDRSRHMSISAPTKMLHKSSRDASPEPVLLTPVHMRRNSISASPTKGRRLSAIQNRNSFGSHSSNESPMARGVRRAGSRNSFEASRNSIDILPKTKLPLSIEIDYNDNDQNVIEVIDIDVEIPTPQNIDSDPFGEKSVENEQNTRNLEILHSKQGQFAAMLDEFLAKMEYELRDASADTVELEMEYKEIKNWILQSTQLDKDQFQTLMTQCLQDSASLPLDDEYAIEEENMRELARTVKRYGQFEACHRVLRTRKICRRATEKMQTITKQNVKKSTKKKDDEELHLAVNRAKKAATILRDACDELLDDHFDFMVFNGGPDPLMELCRVAMIDSCESMAAKSVGISRTLLRDGKREFKQFTVRLGQTDMFGYGPVRCYACVVQRKRLEMLYEVQTTLEGSLIFAQRLLTGVGQAQDRTVKSIVTDDDGNSFFSQCFRSLEESLLHEIDHQIAAEREWVLRNIRESMHTRIEKDEFVNLCDDVAEMLVEARKHRRVIEESHNHKSRISKNVPQVV
jgi:hypothetical protein